MSSNPSLASYRGSKPPTKFAPPLDRIGEHRIDDHPAFRHGLAAPKPAWDDCELVDRFENAFDVWVRNGVAPIADDEGGAGERVEYWAAVKNLAEALLDRPVSPGWDYALTEAVHCKSRDEVGVASARTVCAPLYLPRILRLSPAALIIVLGDQARSSFRSVLTYPDPGVFSKPLKIAGRPRRLLFLAHPNARRSRYPKAPDAKVREAARDWLRKVSARPSDE